MSAVAEQPHMNLHHLEPFRWNGKRQHELLHPNCLSTAEAYCLQVLAPTIKSVAVPTIQPQLRDEAHLLH
ncbi:hypothetical protein D3C73_1424240 [compost metagenome]